MYTKVISTLFFLTVSCGCASGQLCSICEDGSAPRNEDIVIRFFPGSLPQTRYTCGELYYMGKFPGALNDKQCHALHTIVYRPCGCEAVETNLKEVLEFDISNVSGGSSFIFDSSSVNSTATMYSRKEPLLNRSHFDPINWRSVAPVPSPPFAPNFEEELSTEDESMKEPTKMKRGKLRGNKT